MPRLSLWKGAHTNDYKFFDQRIHEMFTAGGTDIYIHKYLGSDTTETNDATKPIYSNTSEKNIQDLLFLENRDRKYESDIYVIRGHYNVQDLDFDLSQFGLFIQNDNVFMTFHLNDMVGTIGRKLMIGDVIELPHLKEFYGLDEDLPAALKRFYVVEDATRSAEGFSQTWWPHLWRVKLKPMVDSQEFSDILDKIADDSGEDDTTQLRDLLSTYQQELSINEAIIQQAEADVPQSGYDTDQFYVLPTKEDGSLGEPEAYTAADGSTQVSADTPRDNGWLQGYRTGDGKAPNGFPVSSGVEFPSSPSEGDYTLRLDYMPNRLFRYNGSRWVKIEDVVRTNTTPGKGNTIKDRFINNTDTITTDDNQTIDSRQSLYKALEPKEDN